MIETMDLNAPLGDSLRTSGCAGCGNVFTSVTGFDRHQRLRPAAEGGGVICLDPAELGMVRDGAGRWKMPASQSKLDHIAAHHEAPEPAPGDTAGDPDSD